MIQAKKLGRATVNVLVEEVESMNGTKAERERAAKGMGKRLKASQTMKPGFGRSVTSFTENSLKRTKSGIGAVKGVLRVGWKVAKHAVGGATEQIAKRADSMLGLEPLPPGGRALIDSGAEGDVSEGAGERDEDIAFEELIRQARRQLRRDLLKGTYLDDFDDPDVDCFGRGTAAFEKRADSRRREEEQRVREYERRYGVKPPSKKDDQALALAMTGGEEGPDDDAVAKIKQLRFAEALKFDTFADTVATFAWRIESVMIELLQ